MLERLVSPLTLADFDATYLRQQPYAQSGVLPEMRRFLSWERLENILKSHNNCWVGKQGRLAEEPHLSSGRLKFAEAISKYQSGYSIFVRHAEKIDADILKISSQFACHFSAPVDVQLYFTPEGQEGFDWHYDIEEVFVFQSVGTKTFYLKKNTVSLRFDAKLCRSEWPLEIASPVLECVLQPGDWLYIPAGMWHKARAVTDSAHLSVGVLLPT